ncbi:angiopoietin-1-like [Rhincodon typus]|uniref:angiopoietin-1-like n=1 Tax=Rhincodon typus TaxID=259920 RepID=UPI002030BBE2|nr:angiopoietin-1-like [Rhincodon typus]
MWPAALALNLLWVSVSLTGPSSQWRGADSPRGHYHRVQHGQCSYTFVLPYPGHCRASMQQQDTNALQRDAPPSEPETSFQKLRHLETATENNTQWLLKVLNQTSRIEIQLLENSLSTNKLEKQLMLQTTEINKIQEWNRLLERKVSDIEAKHRAELGSMRKEKELLQQLVGHQVNAIQELEKRLLTAISNNSGLQQQQLKLLDTVRHLITLITQGKVFAGLHERRLQQDYSLTLPKRLFLKGYSGTAGRQSSLALHGASFSTRDADHDNCHCKCALMLTGGWWFDACGLSNLNGMYYTVGNNIRKLNGIKWHYFRGPSYSLQATSMMIRPLDF